jgi:hypothetical protein
MTINERSDTMNEREDATANCCAECGVVGGSSLKVCKPCMSVKYCNAACQRKHWATHKKLCKQRAAELHDEALFNDPPPKEECPICFLPMPNNLINCASLPPATRLSVPINDFASANEELADKVMDVYYPCCGKRVCGGCIHSSIKTFLKNAKCPFCNSGTGNDQVSLERTKKRVEANDPNSMCLLAQDYYHGGKGLQQDRTKAMELYVRAADLGSRGANHNLAHIYREGGDLKKAKFHCEAAAMAGHVDARFNLGIMELESGNMERAIKHWTIAASAGEYKAMHNLRGFFIEKGWISGESIDSILIAYNNSCAEMRSEARDAYIRNSKRLHTHL